MTLEKNRAYLGDCLCLMPEIESASVDMILCDLPYGTTACAWDTVIPFAPLWAQYRRIIKPRGAIVLTAAQPFTSALVMSAPDLFRHAWVWLKGNAGNFLNAKRAPLKITEDVCVFARGDVSYYPQMRCGRLRVKGHGGKQTETTGNFARQGTTNDQYFPKNTLEISNAAQGGKIHPTQKPVSLLKKLIEIFTDVGDVVIDPVAGSGTTLVAALELDRKAYGFEIKKEYYLGAKKLIENVLHVKQDIKTYGFAKRELEKEQPILFA